MKYRLKSFPKLSKQHPQFPGAKEFENKYGLERCLNISIISFLPEVNPPKAPPKAFPNVEVIISTLPITSLAS